MTIIYLLHGFNVGDRGKDTTDMFIPFLKEKGYRHVKSRREMRSEYYDYVMDLDYGWTGLAGVRLCDKKLGIFMAEAIVPGSIVIAHSNGCAIASFAADAGAAIRGMVMVNPALNKKWTPPQHIRWMDVYYNGLDFWTYVAAVLPGHRWGAMGNQGPSYEDKRVRSYNTNKISGDDGHNAVFNRFGYWGNHIYDRISSNDYL